MQRRVNTFKLGLVVIVVLALFVATLLFIAGVRGLPRSTRTVTVRFQHTDGVPGLKTSSPVMLAGLNVGQVKDVRLKMLPGHAGPPEQRAKELFAVVTAQIDARFPLRSDCRIFVTAPPLGGAGTLVIADIGSSGEEVTAETMIEGHPPGGFNEVVQQLGQRLVSELDEDNPQGLLQLVKLQLNAEDPTTLLGKISRSLDDLNDVTAQVRLQLDPKAQRTLLAKLHTTLDVVNELTANLRNETDAARDDVLVAKVHASLDLLESALATTAELLADNRPAITSAIQHVDSSLAQVDTRVLPTVAEQLDPGQTGSLMAKVHDTVDVTSETVKDLSASAKTIRELLAFHKTDLSRFMHNLGVASDYAKLLVRDVLFHPWRLLKPPAEQEIQLEVLAATRAFADAAGRLDDATATLRSLVEAREGQFVPDDPKLLEIRRELELTFNNFKQAEEALWQLLRANAS